MKNKINTPRVELGYLSIITILCIFILFLISDQTNDLIPIQDTALPAYIVSLLSILFLVGYVYKFGIPNGSIRNIFLVLLLNFVFLFIYSLLQSDIVGIRLSSKLLVYGSIVFLIGFTKWNKPKLLVIVYMFSILTIIIFLQWLLVGDMFTYKWYFHNSNTLGILMYCIIFIHLIGISIINGKLVKVIFSSLLIIDLVLLYVSSSRGAWLALLVSLIIIIVYRYIRLNKLFYKINFFIIIFAVFLFSYLYPKLYSTELGRELNNFLITYTGKNFFSGRHDIWLQLLYVIEEKPIIGYGVSTSASDFLALDLTAHNMYLSTLLQTGLVGLILYCILLFCIWNSLYPNININIKQKKISTLFIAFFAGLLVYQSLEMAFIHGPYSINIVEWLIISIGVGLNVRSGKYEDSLNGQKR